MVRGPLVPVFSCDVPLMRMTGALVAVTSILPEATTAALYPETRVLGLSFVSIARGGGNTAPTNEDKGKLGPLLKGIMERLS